MKGFEFLIALIDLVSFSFRFALFLLSIMHCNLLFFTMTSRQVTINKSSSGTSTMLPRLRALRTARLLPRPRPLPPPVGRQAPALPPRAIIITITLLHRTITITPKRSCRIPSSRTRPRARLTPCAGTRASRIGLLWASGGRCRR